MEPAAPMLAAPPLAATVPFNPDCPGCRALLALVQAQAAQIEALTLRVAALEARLSQNSSNSSRPPSADPPSAPRAKGKQPASGRKRGGQPGHRGTHRDLKPLEAVAEVVEIVPTHCAHCHASLPSGCDPRDPDPVRHQVSELPPVVVVTTEYRLHARSCPACRRRTRAELPKGVPTGAVAPRLQAVCSLLTGAYHLSRRTTRQLVWDLFGEELSLGTLCRLERATAATLADPYQQVAKGLRRARHAHVDETRWWEAHRLTWLWLAATEHLSLFRIDASRSRAAFERLLPPKVPGQQRTVISDRYSAYTYLVGEEWQICWAHLLREFTGWLDAGGAAKPFGERAVAQTHALFHLWHQCRNGDLDRLALREGLTPIRTRLSQVLEEASTSGHWKAAGPARHLLRHYESLWTFASVEGVEPTNNHAERALRGGVLWRKNSFGHQSEGGRAFVERLLTAVVSLRLQGRSVLEYLEAACRAPLSGLDPPSLLPEPTG